MFLKQRRQVRQSLTLTPKRMLRGSIAQWPEWKGQVRGELCMQNNEMSTAFLVTTPGSCLSLYMTNTPKPMQQYMARDVAVKCDHKYFMVTKLDVVIKTVIPELRKQKQADQPDLHCELQVIQDYIMRPCFKKGGREGERREKEMKENRNEPFAC